jgi:streptogramin lyase
MAVITFVVGESRFATYDLPESAAPHDTLLDKAGNVWFADFQHHVISKLDPKTRETVLPARVAGLLAK